MIKLKPPTHTVDGLAVYISLHDPAWDLPRLRAECDVWIGAALADKRDAAPEADRDAVVLTDAEIRSAIARAPVERYYAGKTRYQPDAPDWAADGSPTTARDFIAPGQKPAEFGVRRLSRLAYLAVGEIKEPLERLHEAARLGLRSITADDFKWRAIGDAPAGDAQLEALHAADPGLLSEIGAAVLQLCRPLDHEAETPRSASSRTATA